MRVLTPDQELLARYLTEQGVSRIDRLLIVAELYEPEATVEMLTYIAETMEKDPVRLSETAAKIARKYK